MSKKLYFRFLICLTFLSAGGGFGLSDFSLIPIVRAQTNREITSNKTAELNVTIAFWGQQRDLSMAKRKMPTGERPKGFVVPKQLLPDGNTSQKAKMQEMVENGFQKPLDYADLAEKRLNGELVELPMATKTYFIDTGGSADETEFTSFEFEKGSTPLPPDSPKYLILKKLADDFDGMKYDLNNPQDRKQIKIRLLRMVHPRAKLILEEIAGAYQKQFNRPLKITSMVRSMEYQVKLNATDANSFLVRNANALPPHVTGCAIDIARLVMTAEEQNFVMGKIAEAESQGKIDGVVEFGTNAVFHIFVYADGKPAKK